MSLVLYGHPFSPAVRAVMMTLLERSCTFEFKFLDLPKGEHKTEKYLKMNPFGVVPTLKDDEFGDGFVIYESRAIMRYIDFKYGKNNIKPSMSCENWKAESYGLMEQFLNIEHSYLNPPAGTVIRQRILAPRRGKEPDMTLVAEAVEKLKPVFAVANDELQNKSFFIGEEISLADIAWLPTLDIFCSTDVAYEQIIQNDYPHLGQWLTRMRQRPSWQTTASWTPEKRYSFQ